MFARILVLIALSGLVWSVAPRPSGAHGARIVYRVKPHDTLWGIAAARYGGDARDAIWRIERANDLRDSSIKPGQRLVLP